MIQPCAEVDQLAFVIAEAMWGEETAALYARSGSDFRWQMVHRAAVAVMARQGRMDPTPARLFTDPEREGYRFLQPVPAPRGPSLFERVQRAQRQ